MRRFALYLGVISFMAVKSCNPAYSGQQQPNPQQVLFIKRMQMPKQLPQLKHFNDVQAKAVEKPVQPLSTNAPYMSSEQIRIRKYWTDRQTNSLPK